MSKLVHVKYEEAYKVKKRGCGIAGSTATRVSATTPLTKPGNEIIYKVSN